MNVFAHVAVAARAGAPAPSERFLLGAALSDLASFGGFRLVGRTDDPDVAAGMAFHHRTDDAFHHHPWFRDRNRAAAEALDSAGLPRGAARACAHVGIELLLDGSLHPMAEDRDRFTGALASARHRPGALTTLVADGRAGPWLTHLERVAEVRALPDYGDAARVAHRLHAICARRPRLAFDAAAVDVVAGVLDDLLPAITTSGPDLVDELGRSLQTRS